MPKVLTSLSDRGRCNRNNNSNSNNHASAPKRYQLIAFLGIKASLMCALLYIPPSVSGKNGRNGDRLSNSCFAVNNGHDNRD